MYKERQDEHSYDVFILSLFIWASTLSSSPDIFIIHFSHSCFNCYFGFPFLHISRISHFFSLFSWFTSILAEISYKTWIFLQKHLVGWLKVLTFASAFRVNALRHKNEKERVLWNIDRQISSSTRSICAYARHKCLWVKNEPSIHLLLVVDTQSDIQASWTDISFSLLFMVLRKRDNDTIFTM